LICLNDCNRCSAVGWAINYVSSLAHDSIQSNHFNRDTTTFALMWMMNNDPSWAVVFVLFENDSNGWKGDEDVL
jgi:hypothetical protein